MQEELDKNALRRTLLADRQLLAPEVRRSWDRRITDHVLAWWKASDAHTIGVYWPMRGEPDLRALYGQLAEKGAQLALPMAAQKDKALVFGEWKPGDPLVRDPLGVSVPIVTVRSVKPDALLIPCVGFNAQRLRLGYGGGYYDRTLATLPRPTAIGIAYASCRCNFAGGPHDIALDRIITEQE